MPQPSKKAPRSRASRILHELGNFFKAFALFVYYKLTHPSEERWRAVAVCLALSGIFWFLRAMARPAQYVVPFEVRLKYDRRKYFLPEQPEGDFKASVTGKGWTLAGMWASLHSTPVFYRPELHKGYYEFRPDRIEEYLENRFRGVRVNYVEVPQQEFPVDSMVSRTLPVRFDSGAGTAFHKTAGVCYFGPSAQVENFPRVIDLSQAKTHENIKSVFPEPWQEYICAGQRGQSLASLLQR